MQCKPGFSNVKRQGTYQRSVPLIDIMEEGDNKNEANRRKSTTVFLPKDILTKENSLN